MIDVLAKDMVARLSRLSSNEPIAVVVRDVPSECALSISCPRP